MNYKKIADYAIEILKENSTGFQYIVDLDELEKAFGNFDKHLVLAELEDDYRVASVDFTGDSFDIVLFTKYI